MSSGSEAGLALGRSSRHLATFGFEVEERDARYDVREHGALAGRARDARADAVALVQRGADDERRTRMPPYVSDRWRITDRLIADLGLRWDEQTYLPPGADEQVGPRASVLYRLDGQTDLRDRVRQVLQSQGLADLQIEDGVVDFAPRSTPRARSSASTTVSRTVSRCERSYSRRPRTSARPRYENLFDPLVLLPELRPGRVRIAPERGEARGAEVLLSATHPFSWWLGYRSRMRTT